MLIKLDNKRENINFNFQPKNKLLNNLAEKIKVIEFKNINFSGHLLQKSTSEWQLNANLNFIVIQECVVTLELVTTSIKSKVNRIYITGFCENVGKGNEHNLYEIEYEKLEDSIDLKDLLLEELSLLTPEYPKVRDIEKVRGKNDKKYEQMKDDAENPFLILKKLNPENKIWKS